LEKRKNIRQDHHNFYRNCKNGGGKEMFAIYPMGDPIDDPYPDGDPIDDPYPD